MWMAEKPEIKLILLIDGPCQGQIFEVKVPAELDEDLYVDEPIHGDVDYLCYRVIGVTKLGRRLAVFCHEIAEAEYADKSKHVNEVGKRIG
jgi:hypothetical protein